MNDIINPVMFSGMNIFTGLTGTLHQAQVMQIAHMHTHEQSATPCSDPTQRNLSPALRCSDVCERNRAGDPRIGPSVPSCS